LLSDPSSFCRYGDECGATLATGKKPYSIIVDIEFLTISNK